MSHKGNSRTHSNSAYGADTKRHMSLTSNDIEVLQQFTKEFYIKPSGSYDFEAKSIYSKIIKDDKPYLNQSLSYAILAILLSNVSTIREVLKPENSDEYAHESKCYLYQLISFLNIPEKTKQMLMHLFYLEDYEKLNEHVRQILTSPQFRRYRRQVARYYDAKIPQLTLGIEDVNVPLYNDYLTFLLFLDSLIPRMNGKMPKRVIGYIFPYMITHYLEDAIKVMNHFEYVYSTLKSKEFLEAIETNNYTKISNLLKKYQPLFVNEYNHIINFKPSDIASYNYINYGLYSLVEYYNHSPISKVPLPILAIMLTFENTEFDPETGIIFNKDLTAIPQTAFKDANYKKFVKAILKGINNNKSLLENLYTMTLNEHQTLSRPFSVPEQLVEKFMSRNIEEVYNPYMEDLNDTEVFNQFIDYMGLLLSNPMKYQNSLYKTYLKNWNNLKATYLYEKGNRNVYRYLSTSKATYTLKYLIYFYKI